MLNNKNKITNERTIYQTKQNPVIGCKKVIFGFILLIIVCSIISPIISFIGNIQTYLISYINLTLTRYTAILLFIIIIFIILYIIKNLLSWYFTIYTLTNYRIITKKGFIRTKKTYMQYSTIQDINTSQNLIEKLINVGTISIYSAYDNNDIELKNISNPKNIEEILFNQMHPTTQENNNIYPENHKFQFQNNYKKSKDYYNYEEEYKDHNYEYYNKNYHESIHENYFNDNLEDNIKDTENHFKFEGFNPDTKNNKDNYNDESEIYYNNPNYEDMENYYNNNKQDIQFQQEKNKTNNNQKNPLERHFDKFKK